VPSPANNFRQSTPSKAAHDRALRLRMLLCQRRAMN
jgi:hypothetical protein